MFPRLLRTQILCPGHKNVLDFVQKHFVSATNVSQFAQPKKHYGQQCVRNNVSSFTRALRRWNVNLKPTLTLSTRMPATGETKIVTKKFVLEFCHGHYRDFACWSGSALSPPFNCFLCISNGQLMSVITSTGTRPYNYLTILSLFTVTFSKAI